MPVRHSASDSQRSWAFNFHPFPVHPQSVIRWASPWLQTDMLLSVHCTNKIVQLIFFTQLQASFVIQQVKIPYLYNHQNGPWSRKANDFWSQVALRLKIQPALEKGQIRLCQVLSLSYNSWSSGLVAQGWVGLQLETEPCPRVLGRSASTCISLYLFSSLGRKEISF